MKKILRGSMKKILTILTVALLACSTVFAAVNFSGELVAGYQFQYENEKWTGHVQGQDGDDTNTTKLNLGIADDNGVWSVGIEGVLVADGRVSGDLTLDLMKLFNADSDFSLKLGLLANDEQTGLRAYSNNSGKNWDRVRTGADGLWTSLTLGYTDLVQVQVAGSPATEAVVDGAKIADTDAKTTGWKANTGDVVVSALVKPVEGVAVSVDWAYDGENKNFEDPITEKSKANEGVVGGAADINVATLAGLDFDLGVAVADRYEYESKYNVLAATVYGGVDEVNGYVEYALQTEGDNVNNFLVAQVNLGFVEGLPIDVYFGANNLEKFADTFFVGGDVAYTVSGVTFKLGVEYSQDSSSKKNQ